MVKDKQSIRSLFQSKESPTKPMHKTSPARPPLSAFSASARNNLSAGNTSPASSKSEPKIDERSPQVKIRGVRSEQLSYMLLDNVDSNVGSSSSNSSSPERFSTPCGTPLKSKSRRSSSVMRLPFSSADLENLQGQNLRGAYEDCRTHSASNTSLRGTSSEDEAASMDDSDPSSTSGSEVENVCLSRPSPARRQSSVYLSRQASAIKEGQRKMSLGPKIEAAVSKLEKTPGKHSRPLPCGTASASPVSLRASAQRALVRQDHHQQAQTQFELEANPTFWDDHNVQVVIRTRPTNGKESASQDFSRCLKQDGPHAITWLGQPETHFTFDHVAGENISQEKLFKVVGLPVVENCMAGYNSCLFAYGQTGSGKTHTMLGEIVSIGDCPSNNRGMTPRIFECLFSRIQKEEQDRQLQQLQYVCKCSFLEVYNEQITDLLEPSSSNLQMREDSKKGVYVENLSETVVSSVQDVILLLLKGAANRKVASTNMNRESSRSHSVFTCIIESKWVTNSMVNMRFGRLNLVDLAGSEREKSSGAEGERLKEASSINKSLSTLGLVIMTLVDMENGKPRHIPYRDSKLTFLLQDSLGGNSKTAIVATISPSSCCAMETLSTLKFAQRAKLIQNNAIINEDGSEEVLALQHEVQELKEEVNRLSCQTLTSMQRECRRASKEFFRMSLTRRDLFSAAEKELADKSLNLKSAELLEKVKFLEAVLAGALRREQVAESVAEQQHYEVEKAKKLIEDRELEVLNCKKLLHLNADGLTWNQSSQDINSSSTSKQHVILAENLGTAKNLEQNSTVSNLEMENFRLTEQLRRYRMFFDSGEKETMTAEIQGLRHQVLEFLGGKVAVEKGLLSATITQSESYRKELETCRNDLTNCLEASSQLQRQVGELQILVNQLTEENAYKERELIQIKDSVAKNADVAKLKEEEIHFLRTEWNTASAKLYHDLVEGERALFDAGQEMAELLGENSLPKNMMDVPARWSIESVKSLKEVDIEHDYFKGRDSCNSDDMFGERKTSRRKRSFVVTPRISFMTEEKLKLEADVARLELELEDHKRRILKEEHIQEELDRVVRENFRFMEEMEVLAKTSRNMSEVVEENADLKVELQQLRVKLHEQNDAIEVSRAQIPALDVNLVDLEKMKSEKDKAFSLISQELSGFQEKNIQLLNEISLLSLELNGARIKAEETEAALVEMAHTNDELTRESALQAEKDADLQTCLSTKVSDLKVAFEKQEQENSDLETEIERMGLLLHGAECRLKQLETTMKDDRDSIIVLEEAKENLDSELKMKSLKLASTDIVQEQLRITVSSLHVELENKTKRIEELDLIANSKAEAFTRERKLIDDDYNTCQLRIGELEACLAEKREFLQTLEEALLSATAIGDALTIERDSARAQVDLAQAEATSTSTQIQELREILKTEAHLSLKSGMQNVIAERDDLKSRFSILVQKLDYFQDYSYRQVAEVNVLHGELLFSIISEYFLQELMPDMEAKAAYLEAEKVSLDDDLAHTNKNMKQLEFEHLRTSEAADQLNQEKIRLESCIAELQLERDSLNCQLAQRIESKSSLHHQVLAISERPEQFLEEIDNLKSQIESLQSKNCRLEKDLALKVYGVDSLGADVMAAQSLTAQSLEQVDEMRARICTLEDKHHDMEMDIALENGAVSPSNAQVMTRSMVRVLDDLNQRITAILSEKDILQKSILQKDEAMSNMDAELTALKRSLCPLESLRSNLTDLQFQKSNDEDELQIVREKQGTLQDEIQRLELRLADSEESNNALKLELAENITEMSSLQDRICIASRSFYYNHEEMKAMKAEIGLLLKERDVLRAQADHKLATISSLENELVGARASAGSSRDRIAALETKVLVLQAERDCIGKQITELEVDVISTLQIELTEAQKSLKSLDIEIAEARRVSDCFADENSALQARIVAVEAEKSNTQAEILSQTTQIMSLEADLAAVRSSSMTLKEEVKTFEAKVLELERLKAALETEVAEIRVSMSLQESELLSTITVTSSEAQENDERKMKIGIWQEQCCALAAQLTDANQEMERMKAQITQQELQLSSLDELLAQKAEALQHVVSKAVHSTQEHESVRSEVEDLKEALRKKDATLKEQENALKVLEISMSSVSNESDVLMTLEDERDQALVEVQALHGELRAAQALLASHKSSVLEAQKFAEVNILRASGKEEEARTLEASVSALKIQNRALEKQLEATKRDADTLRKACDEFEIDLRGMKNRMTMLQAVYSTGSRNFKGFQAAQAASLDLQKTLEDKESEVSQMYKRMTVLHSQNEVQANRLLDMETELAHVHQELDDLQSQCEDKDAQLRALDQQLKEAETLTQDVMRDLHNVKLDISNYASLVSQQQLELISERARHSDEAREKDEELSNLQTQLNQERQNWMMEMNHKQAEIVVARVLSEKMRLKNKSIAAEYKRLKADYGGKKKKLKILEQQLTQLTTDTRRFSIGTEGEADFDEVQQFQALLAQANDHERATRKRTVTDHTGCAANHEHHDFSGVRTEQEMGIARDTDLRMFITLLSHLSRFVSILLTIQHLEVVSGESPNGPRQL